MVACGKGIVRDLEVDVYTLLYLKWIANKDLLYNTWSSAQCYVAPRMGRESGGESIHVYVWLSPFAVHLKLSHCESVIPQYKRKSLQFFLKLKKFLGISFSELCDVLHGFHWVSPIWSLFSF